MLRPPAAIIPLLAALALAGCSAWHATRVPEPAPPAAARVQRGPLRVRLADGRTVHLAHAYVDGDSLRGEVASDDRAAVGARHAAFALRDVRAIDDRGFSTGKTMGLILAILAIGGYVLRIAVGGIVGSESD